MEGKPGSAPFGFQSQRGRVYLAVLELHQGSSKGPRANGFSLEKSIEGPEGGMCLLEGVYAAIVPC